jgi:hypothetical protein
VSVVVVGHIAMREAAPISTNTQTPTPTVRFLWGVEDRSISAAITSLSGGRSARRHSLPTMNKTALLIPGLPTRCRRVGIMNRSRFRGAWLVSLVVLFGCPLTIPPPSQDTPPTVTIQTFESDGGSGWIDLGQTQSDATVQIDPGRQARAWAGAQNLAGGVASLKVTIKRSTTTLYDLTTTSTPDSQGNVVDTLLISGSDGAGHPGNQPLIFYVPAKMVATATNFNNMTITRTVSYIRKPQPPKITAFTASPNNGYINVGESATLHWSINECGAGCAVAMVAHDGVNYQDLLASFSGLGSSGSMVVSPRRSTLTKYTLSAQNPVGTATADTIVQLYAPMNTPPSCPMYFYFRITDNSGDCYGTIAQCAPDSQSAVHFLTYTYPQGYSFTPISEQDFSNGCP